MRIRLLGAGTSSGVPRIGNDWGSCDPREPKNRRRRASIIVETDETRILVDTSPDLREQLLDAQASRFDAVIWTHDHADHTHGIDDLRQIVILNRAAVEGYARPVTLKSMQERFYYAFEGKDGYPPTVKPHELPDDSQDRRHFASVRSISRMAAIILGGAALRLERPIRRPMPPISTR